MSASLPLLRDVVRRFNAACHAFNEAVVASQANNPEVLHAKLLESARDLGSAVELAVVGCAATSLPGQAPRDLSFFKSIELLAAQGNPRLSNEQAAQLKKWKALRNRAEHHPIVVPSLTHVIEALSGTRRFLIESFGHLDALVDPGMSASESSAPHGRQPARGAPTTADDGHRREGPKRWVRYRLDEGRRRLNAGDIKGAPLTETEIRSSLIALARALLEQGGAPSEPLPVDAIGATLGAHRRLYVEGGWLIGDAGFLRFCDPRLPAVLIGYAIASAQDGAPALYQAVERRRHWAEAAWAATAAGDAAIGRWVRPLLEDGDLDLLPDRVVTASAALAGVHERRIQGAAELVQQAAAAAAAGIVWFVPPIDAPWSPVSEPQTTWQLNRAEWQRAVLDLAKTTGALAAAVPPSDWRRPGGSLGRLVAALGLPPRLSDEAANAVFLLASPWPAEGVSPLDEQFFRRVFATGGGVAARVDGEWLRIWVAEYGAPALWRGDPHRAARMLTIQDAGHPAGVLLNSGRLLADWCNAWKAYAAFASPGEAASTWVLGATRAATAVHLDLRASNVLLHDAPELLRQRGVWEAARILLEDALVPNVLPTEPDPEQVRYGAALFAFAELSPTKWRQKLAAWTADVRLPWRLLIEAGTPHDAVARWCLDKLQQKEREPVQVEGPVGVIASEGEILKTEGWEMAYRQARQALDWLLDHGDESAVAFFAEACFSVDETQHFDPVVGRLSRLNFSVPLSQLLWGRTLGRREGRAALFARIERGANIGRSVHFLAPDFSDLSTIDGVWEMIVLQLLRDDDARGGHGLSSAPERVAMEARRLITALEHWLQGQQLGPWRWEAERGPWIDRAMRRSKALVVLCGALHGIDVTEQLEPLLRAIVDDARPEDAELLVQLGLALDQQCLLPAEPSMSLLALATTRPVAAALLAHDYTHAFWATMLRRQGTEAVMKLADDVALPSLGLGLFDALASDVSGALACNLGRPDLLRAALVRSAEGRIQLSQEFHDRAWATPRQAEDIPDLDNLPDGDWLEYLIERSREWVTTDREGLLRRLAQRSLHTEVRRRCLNALIERSGDSADGRAID